MQETAGMNKQELLENLRAWENIDPITAMIIQNPQYYRMMMDIALYSTDPKSWRAAYIADKIHEKHPQLIVPFIEEIIERVKTESNNSKKRHFLKQISLNRIPAEHFGFLLDYCIGTFTSEKEDIAVRVHAMQILFNISEEEPDLKPEILALIENEMEHHPTAGIVSRGKKIAALLYKSING